MMLYLDDHENTSGNTLMFRLLQSGAKHSSASAMTWEETEPTQLTQTGPIPCDVPLNNSSRGLGWEAIAGWPVIGHLSAGGE